MKVHLPIMVQDPMTTPFKGAGGRIVEGFYIHTDRQDEVFLDGPVTKRVAVLDFDAATGALLPGAKFRPPDKKHKVGRYLIANDKDLYARDFNQVSVMGAVWKAIRLFEGPEALGRPIRWAFDAPQLLVVPRAGEWANAFYERDSHSLQFFSFPNPNKPDETVHTSLSRDIVAHETGHALLDGIAPSLYNSLTPQSLAIHEAIADLTALSTAFRSNELTRRVLDQTRGSIRNPTAFSSLAPEFGKALDRSGRASALRSLWNDKTLNPKDKSVDEQGRPNFAPPSDPHALSEVLSGALYRVMVRLHDFERNRLGGGNPEREFSASGRALATSSRFFQQMIFRALDYMPPGEVSFADYGRALVAANVAELQYRANAVEWVAEEFARRGIVGRAADLKAEFFGDPFLKGHDLSALLDSDWAAYEFANKHRKVLNIPEGRPFQVHPRLHAQKVSTSEGTPIHTEELIFKISWNVEEKDPFHPRLPKHRRVTAGTTLVLALDNDYRKIKSLLTTGLVDQKPARDAMIRTLAAQGRLAWPGEDRGLDGRRMAAPVCIDVREGVLKVHGAARLLHFDGRRP